MTVRIETEGNVWIIVLSRPSHKNAVDRDTAAALAEAFRAFEADDSALVGILWGEGGTFCAGADLRAIAAGNPNRIAADGDGPMGPSRMVLKKPTIAAISGYAVAGGLELACFCDLRVAEEDATLGVFCRRFGVPLIDGGTVRLPRIIGMGRALDLILTGRPVSASEALSMGLVNRVVPNGEAKSTAISLAQQIAGYPQMCMRADRQSAYEQWELPLADALANEFRLGLSGIGEAVAGATRFSEKAPK